MITPKCLTDAFSPHTGHCVKIFGKPNDEETEELADDGGDGWSMKWIGLLSLALLKPSCG